MSFVSDWLHNAVKCDSSPVAYRGVLGVWLRAELVSLHRTHRNTHGGKSLSKFDVKLAEHFKANPLMLEMYENIFYPFDNAFVKKAGSFEKR